MPTTDLFGNIIPDKTKKPTYREYINSSKWRKKAKEKKDSVDNKCKNCGRDKHMRKLTVHHLNYEHFGNEPLEDLVVLCDKCHEIADWKRRIEVAKDNYEKFEEARFQGWVRTVYGDNCPFDDDEFLYLKYQAWLEKKGEW